MVACLVGGAQPMNLFSAGEQTAIMAFWNAKGRYEVGVPPDAPSKGLWQVRQTPEGSKWLWTYYRTRGYGKVNPVVDPKAGDERQKALDTWIEQRYARDVWEAQGVADAANARITGKGPERGDAPPDPGPVPDELVAAAGNPPKFVNTVVPMRHIVTFEGGAPIVYLDNPVVRRKYAYYRYPQGVMSAGVAVRGMSTGELGELFKGAGIDAGTQRVMSAVSLLEGGFDSVNTYDTGYVSVGFIQFAALTEGGGSLGSMMKLYKQSNPTAFQRDFRRYGLDVTDGGLLAVLDPTTGGTLTGPEATMKIIEDKRLIAVFQRAGRESKPFRVAQLAAAKANFYPGDDVVNVTIGAQAAPVRVGDVFKSEAGLATLMDRKVNTGKLDPLAQVLSDAVARYGFDNPAKLADVEGELVRAMQYRKDYLADPNLSQPRNSPNLTSRHKTRGSATNRGAKQRPPRSTKRK